jgi:hypothetical protein
VMRTLSNCSECPELAKIRTRTEHSQRLACFMNVENYAID